VFEDLLDGRKIAQDLIKISIKKNFEMAAQEFLNHGRVDTPKFSATRQYDCKKSASHPRKEVIQDSVHYSFDLDRVGEQPYHPNQGESDIHRRVESVLGKAELVMIEQN